MSRAGPLFVRGESVLALCCVSAAVGGHHNYSVDGLKCPWDGCTMHRFVQALCSHFVHSLSHKTIAFARGVWGREVHGPNTLHRCVMQASLLLFGFEPSRCVGWRLGVACPLPACNPRATAVQCMAAHSSMVMCRCHSCPCPPGSQRQLATNSHSRSVLHSLGAADVHFWTALAPCTCVMGADQPAGAAVGGTVGM